MNSQRSWSIINNLWNPFDVLKSNSTPKWPTKVMSLSEKYFLNKFIFLAQNKCNIKPNDNLMFSLINVCMYTT